MKLKICLLLTFFLSGFQILRAQNPTLIEQLYRLDYLPTFKQSIKIASFSSYDRKGGNDDGFAGTYSFVCKEADGLIIAEMSGPGVVTRIWTPTSSDDVIEFYFDGETAPRISEKFSDLFSGKVFPFLAPISGIGAGGFYTYLPIEYRKSLKIKVKANNFNFYQINYATFAPDAQIESYDPNAAPKFKEDLARAQKFINSSGADLSGYGTPNPASIKTKNFTGELTAGKSLTLFESKKGGRIVGLKISPANLLADKERDIVLKIYYEGENAPSVNVPVGDFFGAPAMKSVLVGTADNADYTYLPMPFEKAIKIELSNEKTSGAVEVSAEIKFTDEPLRKTEGKLYAVWHRENLTTEGKPYTFLETSGRGHLIGVILQAGANRVVFKIVGKNEQSSGLGFDVYRIIFEKAD